MSERILFKGAYIIDGTGAAAKKANLLIEGKKIIEIGNFTNESAECIDLSGKVIMPGMINAHVHICFDGDSPDSFGAIAHESSNTTAIRAVNNLKRLLQSGVTWFRDMGGRDYIDIDLRNARKQGLVDGPQFIAAGKLLTMTGGHGWSVGRECDGVDEVRKAAREQLKAGADFIKIMATGGILTPGTEPGTPQLCFEEIQAAVEEANKAGKKTAAHAQGSAGVMNALRAGIDSIEHGVYLTDETIEEMLKRGTYLIPTLIAPCAIYYGGIEAGIPAFAVEKSGRVLQAHKESFIKACKAGINIAMGTDAGTPLNKMDMSAHEIELMVNAGMSNMDAVVSATRNSARLLGIDDEYGTLEKGKAADFIVLDSDPLADIKALQHSIIGVYKHGILVNRNKSRW